MPIGAVIELGEELRGSLPDEGEAAGWTDALVTQYLEFHYGPEALGVTNVSDLAARTGLGANDVEHGLVMTEAQGFVLRGRYTPDATSDEVCDRRLLARIHRYTLDRLRPEADPVSRQDYMRFLLRWQRLSPKHRAEGRGGLREVLARYNTEGFRVISGGVASVNQAFTQAAEHDLSREFQVPCVVSCAFSAPEPAPGTEVELDCSGVEAVLRA